jgi:hypothetical protein
VVGEVGNSGKWAALADSVVALEEDLLVKVESVVVTGWTCLVWQTTTLEISIHLCKNMVE